MCTWLLLTYILISISLIFFVFSFNFLSVCAYCCHVPYSLTLPVFFCFYRKLTFAVVVLCVYWVFYVCLSVARSVYNTITCPLILFFLFPCQLIILYNIKEFMLPFCSRYRLASFTFLCSLRSFCVRAAPKWVYLYFPCFLTTFPSSFNDFN